MAKVIRAAGVKPEIELFDSGDIALMHDLLKDGTLTGPLLCSFVMGVRYGFQAVARDGALRPRPAAGRCAVHRHRHRPRRRFPSVALSYLAGGHVRVGLEDGVYLARGVLAPSNAAMVEKARRHRRGPRRPDRHPAQKRATIAWALRASTPGTRKAAL